MTYEQYTRWRDQRHDGPIDLSIVIPAYDESARIVPTIASIAAHVSATGRTWELIVSDDGSTDGTPDLVRGLGMANVRVVGDGENHGKGAAVRTGLRAARGEMILFSDADMSTPIDELDGLIAAVEAGADVAIGSRAAEGAEEAAKSLVRRIVSGVFRILLKVLFPVGIEDSQCGFKLFSRDAAQRLVDAQTIDGFSFDLELLWVANRLGMTVVEQPVRWIDAPGSKVDPMRVAMSFLVDMVRIRLRHRGTAAARTGLRVAVVSPHPPSKRTLTEYGQHLVRSMAENPDVSEVILLSDRTPDGIAAPDGVTVDACWEFDSLGSTPGILRAVRRHRPDVVLFNIQFASFGERKVPAALGLLAPAALRLLRVPNVVLLHNLVDTVDLGEAGFTQNRVLARILTGIGRVLTRIVLLADRVAVTIPAYVEILRERYGATNVYLAPHGSFGEAVRGDTAVPVRPRLLAFGKFGTYKKIEDLVDAYRTLLPAHPDLELVIAGTDSPNSAGYLAGVAEANQDLPGLHFTGYVAEEDVASTFSAATMVVFPYTGTTGSSGPLHQAGEHGRAAVLPAIGDFIEVISDEGYDAETFEPGDVPSLAAAIARLLEDQARREEIASRNAAASAGLPMRAVVDLHVLHLAAAA